MIACVVAATGAVRASPPESLSSSWNGPSLNSQQGPSVVPRDPAHSPPSPDQTLPGHAQHGRQHGRLGHAPQQPQEAPEQRQDGRQQGRPGHASQQPQEPPGQREAEANRDISRPDSAAYKAKVGLHSLVKAKVLQPLNKAFNGTWTFLCKDTSAPWRLRDCVKAVGSVVYPWSIQP